MTPTCGACGAHALEAMQSHLCYVGYYESVTDSEVALSPQPDVSDQEKGEFVSIQDIVGKINRKEDEETLPVVGEGAVKLPKRRKPRRGEDFNLRQALLKADFWLLLTPSKHFAILFLSSSACNSPPAGRFGIRSVGLPLALQSRHQGHLCHHVQA